MRPNSRRLYNRVRTRPFLFFAILLIGLSFVPALRSGAAKFLGRVGAPVAGAPEPAAPFFAPGVTATKVATLGPAGPGGDENGNGKVNRGDTLIYTINIANAGVSPADDALGMQFNDTIDLNTTLVAGSLNVSPLARDDSYATIGNTLLEVGVTPSGNVAVSVTNPATDSIFDNDSEYFGDTFTLRSVEAVNFVAISVTAPTEQGGSVTVEADGNFSYTPPVGFSGADAFDYVITDDGPDNILGNADDLTGPGRVTINVNAAKVWYVKNDAPAGGLGRSSDPFDTLVEAQTASAAGDTIYVFFGNGTTTGQDAGFTLKANQRLIGNGVELNVPVSVNGGPNPTVLRAAGTQPMIGNSAGVGVTATNVGGIEIRGLNVGATTDGIAFTVSNTGAATYTGEIANNTIRATGVPANAIYAGNLSNLASSGRVNIHDNVITSASAGIGLQRTSASGTFYVTGFSSNSISGASSFGVTISAIPAPVVFDSNPATTAFDTVAGGNTVVGSAGDAVSLTGLALDDVAGDISFADIDIFAGTPRALFIDGPGSSFNAGAGTGFRLTASGGNGTLSTTSGAAIEVFEANINISVASVTSANATAAAFGAIGFTDVSGTFSAPAGTVTDPIGSGVFVDGNNVATAALSVNYGGTITDDVGFPVRVEDVAAAATTTVTISGAVTDNNDGDGTEQGIRILNATGATVTFRGGLLIRTTSNAAFSASGGGTVNVCDENPCNPAATGALVNTLTSTTGTALNVSSTTIGVNNLEFRSISASGAANAIVLNTTGASGSLVVKGNGGSCTGIADCTGGVIQNSTNAAISLTSTTSPSFTRIAINNAARSGIDGQQVNNFTLANSFINNVGTGAAGQYEESNIAFNSPALTGNAVWGTISITNNILTNARRHGIQIENWGVAPNTDVSNTIANLTVSDNTLTSSTNSTVSLGSAILVLTQGSATTNSHLSTGTVNHNTITNFPSGEGILFGGGSGDAANNNSATLGATGTPVNITNNQISGQAAAGQHTGLNSIRASFNGQVGVMNFNISCNGNTVAPCNAPGVIQNVEGQTVSGFAGGSVTGTTTIDRNVSILNHTVAAGTAGIAVQVDDGPAAAGTSAADYNFIITNNSVSQFDGFGIRAIARASNGKMDLDIKNNKVASTIMLPNRNAIRVDSGSAVGDTTMCMDMTGNTDLTNTALDGSGVNAGMGVRKQGSVATTNDFGIVGIGGAPGTIVTNAAVTAYVGSPVPPGQNLTNAAGGVAGNNGNGNGVDLISGSNYTACAHTAPIPPPADETSAVRIGMSPANGEISPVIDGMVYGDFKTPRTLLEALGTFSEKPRVNVETANAEVANAPADRGIARTDRAVPLADNVEAATIPAKLSSFVTALGEIISPTVFAQRVNHNPLVSSDDVKRPESGETVSASIGTLPAGKSVTVVFKATISIGLGFTQVSNQGTISGSNFANRLTDDPAVAGAANPTVTQIAAPDLTAVKTNNVSGTRQLNSAWNWTIAVTNGGTDDAIFTNGQTVFSDNLPDTNITYGSPTTNNANVTCTINGSFNLVCVAGASGLTLTGPGGTFNITVPVTGASVAGAYVNPRSGGACSVDPNAVIDEGSNEGNNTCTNTVNVFTPPTVVKSFLPTAVAPGGISTLSIQITNPAANPAPLTGIAFTDTFPAGLQVAASPLATNTCNGALTPAPAGGNTSITLAASSLNAGASCTVTVNVTPTTGGAKVNNVTVASTEGGNAAVATATLTVGKAPLDFDGDSKTDYAVVRDSGLPLPNSGASDPTTSDSDPGTPLGDPGPPRDGTLGSMHRGYYFKLPGEKFDPLMPRIERPGDIEANQMRWLINTSGPSADLNILFGTLNDFPVPADYDGDGICDVAVWTGGVAAQFRVLTSSSGFVTTVTYTLGNTSSDPSVVGDYDGDGKADPAVMNANTGQFTYLGGATHATSVTVTPVGAFGGGFPIPGDYDGDGKYDFVLETRDGINPTQAHFYRWTNTGSLTPPATDNFIFGNYRDVIIPGDYDGDGKTDIGLASIIVNPMAWRIRVTPTGTLLGPFNLGDPNVDYTITGDYNGDQKGEITIWHPSGTVQFQSLLAPTYAGPTTNFSWGQSGDYPVAYFNSH